MTAERDGKSGRGQPDLLASLPAERPAPGIDLAAIEELLTGIRDLLEQVAGPRFGWRTVLACLIVFVLGMVLESDIHLFYRWL